MGNKKKNNIVLIGAVVLAVLFIGVGIVNLATSGSGGFSILRIFQGGSREIVARTYDLDGFTSLRFSGTWNIELQEGDEYQVNLEVSENLADRLNIRLSGDTLVLGINSGFLNFGTLRAEIVMPSLSNIEGSGAVEVLCQDFVGNQLDVELSGAAKIEMIDCSYEDLNLSSSGAVSAELRDSLFNNAHVDLSGAASVEVTMNGGQLTGSISGGGSVDYWGSVSYEDISVSGAASIDAHN
ncbi:MAG: GIN domain-containing protein [Spirochaetia bacterium]